MPRSKGVRVWVVWFKHSRGWTPIEARTTWEEANAARVRWRDRLPHFFYRITSGTVMPPGEKP